MRKNIKIKWSVFRKVLFFLAFISYFKVGQVNAATIVVNATDDVINGDTTCSLREAFDAAQKNVATGGCLAGDDVDDTIDLTGLTGDLNLTGPEFLVNSTQLKILGPGSSHLTLNGVDQTHRLFKFKDSGVQSLEISGLTLSEFGAPNGNPFGGAIHVLNGDSLNLMDVVFYHNKAKWGGAIYNQAGNLTIHQGTFLENEADYAGAIINNKGNVVVEESVFHGNIGHLVAGAIDNGGTFTMSTSTIDQNNGGGLGGAISNENGHFILHQSTLSHNIADAGGALFNYGIFEATNVTMSGNSANSYGGAIYNDLGGTLYFYQTTVAANIANLTDQVQERVGAGIYQADSNDFVYLENTILADNLGSSAQNGDDCWGKITTGGVNLIEESDGCSGMNPAQDILHTDPLLQPLTSGDFSTATMALNPYSPAKDVAQNGAAVDQRGVSRPEGGKYDIGAYEFRNFIDGIFIPQAPGGSDISVQMPSAEPAPQIQNAQIHPISPPLADPDISSPSANQVIEIKNLPEKTTPSNSNSFSPYMDIVGNFAENEIVQLSKACPIQQLLGKMGQTTTSNFFKPRMKVTRGQLIFILVSCRFGQQSKLAGNTPRPFRDVAQNYFAAAAIAKAKSANIISGYADGNFYPSKKVSFSEAVKMLTLTWIPEKKLAELQSKSPDDLLLKNSSCKISFEKSWYASYFVVVHESLGDFPLGKNRASLLCFPDRPLSRADMAMLMTQIMDFAKKFQGV